MEQRLEPEAARPESGAVTSVICSVDKSVLTNLPSVPRTSSTNRSRALFARDGTYLFD